MDGISEYEILIFFDFNLRNFNKLLYSEYDIIFKEYE